MANQDDNGIAAPGFAGFVPSMKYQFGLTFGNAARTILKTDPSLKKGAIQQEYLKQKASKAAQNTRQVINSEDTNVWKAGKKYATGDDRFSFPPVPGYTGYIPRSQEHFGRSFVETTNASLSSFQRMLRAKNQLPPRVERVQSEYKEKRPCESPKVVEEKAEHVAPQGQKAFISGYTGYIPRLQNHFGVPYSRSVRDALEEFAVKPAPKNPYISSKPAKQTDTKIEMISPIPGFTGFIPGSRTCYSMTFGKTSNVSYENFNKRDGRVSNGQSTMRSFELSKNLPIPGYKGHST
jgi:hypothetical protein